MKKFLITSFLLSLIFTGCNKTKTASLPPVNQNSQSIDDIIAQSTQDAPVTVLPIPTEEVTLSMGVLPSQKEMYDAVKPSFTPASQIDIDLSQMSSSMIYSMVFEMICMPEMYEDKNLKVRGNFVVYISEETGDRHYAIVIPDATQCCQQGIEFIWFGDNKTYPQDFPPIGTEIELTGRYKSIYTKEGFLINFIEAVEIRTS